MIITKVREEILAYLTLDTALDIDTFSLIRVEVVSINFKLILDYSVLEIKRELILKSITKDRDINLNILISRGRGSGFR